MKKCTQESFGCLDITDVCHGNVVRLSGCLYIEWIRGSGYMTQRNILETGTKEIIMDHIDREILQILQHNARASLKMIAEKTFLSSPAVSARIEKLEKDGIITSYQAQIDPMKLGYHILAFINLNVLPEDKQKFYHYAEEIPNILECSSVTGEFSVIMKVAFASTMQLDSFLGQLQKFGKTSTQVVFATHVGPRGVQVQD